MAVFSLSQSDVVRVDARNSTETNSPPILQREEDLAYPLKFTGILTLGGEKKCFFFIFTCVMINRLKCNSSNYFLFPLINVTILPFRSQIKKKKEFSFLYVFVLKNRRRKIVKG